MWMEGHQVPPAIYQMNRVPRLAACKGQGAQLPWATLHHAYCGSYAAEGPALGSLCRKLLHKGDCWPPHPLFVELLQSGHWRRWAQGNRGKHQYQGLAAQVTFGHDLMHGNREEEDGVAVVGPGASAEVLLHGLHDGEELVGQHGDIVEDDLQQGRRKPQE